MNIGGVQRTKAGLSLRRISGVALLLLVGVLALMQFAGHARSATAATVSFSQCNNREAGPGGAPLTVTCDVNIVNSITPSGNSSTVTFSRTCTLNPCTGDVINVSDVVNAVHQCNGSDNVGGSRTVCNVNVVNNIVVNGPASTGAITVSQCVGSGGGGGTDMSACIPSSQGSPTVVQCNGSGNGGGGKMTCNASGTTSALFPVLVDQCNGSENGGGSFVTCTTRITSNITVLQIPTATPFPTPTLVPGLNTPTPIPVLPGLKPYAHLDRRTGTKHPNAYPAGADHGSPDLPTNAAAALPAAGAAAILLAAPAGARIAAAPVAACTTAEPGSACLTANPGSASLAPEHRGARVAPQPGRGAAVTAHLGPTGSGSPTTADRDRLPA